MGYLWHIFSPEPLLMFLPLPAFWKSMVETAVVALCVDYNYDPTANRDRIPVVTTAVLVYLFFIDS